jgi:hypothetical protein
MALSQDEKRLIGEALQVYIQLVGQQMPQEQVQQVAQIAQGIMKKLDNLGAGGGKKPAGITDEWFKNVCKKCPSLGPEGCKEKVTEKYPGKCDPILKYEQQKRQKKK